MRWKFYTRLLLAMAMKCAVGDEQEAESGPAEAQSWQRHRVGSTNWGQGAESESHYETDAKGPTSMRQENPGCGLSKWKKKGYPCDEKYGNYYACSPKRGLNNLDGDYQYFSCWRSCDEGTDECITSTLVTRKPKGQRRNTFRKISEWEKDQWCWARGQHLHDSCTKHEDCQWAAAAPCQPCGLSTWNKKGYPCDQQSGNNYGCSTVAGSLGYYCWRSCDEEGTDTNAKQCQPYSKKSEWCYPKVGGSEKACSKVEDCETAGSARMVCAPWTGNNGGAKLNPDAKMTGRS